MKSYFRDVLNRWLHRDIFDHYIVIHEKSPADINALGAIFAEAHLFIGGNRLQVEAVDREPYLAQAMLAAVSDEEIYGGSGEPFAPESLPQIDFAQEKRFGLRANGHIACRLPVVLYEIVVDAFLGRLPPDSRFGLEFLQHVFHHFGTDNGRKMLTPDFGRQLSQKRNLLRMDFYDLSFIHGIS